MSQPGDMAGVSDEALMARIAQGETDAFVAFYDRHAPLLYSIAFRILENDSDAQDAVQEALVLIWERAAAYDRRLGKPLSWSVALTRNKAVDRLRASTRRHSRVVSATAEEMEPVAVVERTPAHSSLTAEVAGAVGAALATLTQDQHQAIEMAFFQGLSQSEIAAALGEPLGTVKARIRRGMLQLREQLTAVWTG